MCRKKGLDLNILPEDDFITLHSSSSPSPSPERGSNRKEEAKDEKVKVYECRFCSLKFTKSQALGGHMNRHRQERETEILNRARQLVFNNENPLSQLGAQPVAHGGYNNHYQQQAGCNMGTSVYHTRLFSGNPTTVLPPLFRRPPPPPINNPYPISQPINKSFIGYVRRHQFISAIAAPPPDSRSNI